MARLQLTAGKVTPMRKAHPNAFTPAKQAKFLAALTATCNVSAACRAARVSSATVYRRRLQSAAFRARWAEALREAYARLELALLERMINGTVRTRTRSDGLVDKTHEYPNAVALQLLRLHRGASAEAAAEQEAVDADELRERIARRIERLRDRMAAERAAAGDGEAGR